MTSSLVRVLPVAILVLALSAPGQTPIPAVNPAHGAAARQVLLESEQPDAERTRDQLRALFDKFPPSLREVLALDPSLLSNPSYMASYPSLTAFVAAHPEIHRNPAFFLGEPRRDDRPDPESRVYDAWQSVLAGLAVFTGLGMAIGLLAWLIRTFVDYRRWSRLAKVQTDVHSKLLDRFSSNEELLAYIQSPAGAKFLESSPIRLDPGPRTLGAPLGRILWSLQGGIVLVSLGIGMKIIGSTANSEAARPFQAIGLLALALGAGFAISAIISYVVSRRLGLIEAPVASPGPEA